MLSSENFQLFAGESDLQIPSGIAVKGKGRQRVMPKGFDSPASASIGGEEKLVPPGLCYREDGKKERGRKKDRREGVGKMIGGREKGKGRAQSL